MLEADEGRPEMDLPRMLLACALDEGFALFFLAVVDEALAPPCDLRDLPFLELPSSLWGSSTAPLGEAAEAAAYEGSKRKVRHRAATHTAETLKALKVMGSDLCPPQGVSLAIPDSPRSSGGTPLVHPLYSRENGLQGKLRDRECQGKNHVPSRACAM